MKKRYPAQSIFLFASIQKRTFLYAQFLYIFPNNKNTLIVICPDGNDIPSVHVTIFSDHNVFTLFIQRVYV